MGIHKSTLLYCCVGSFLIGGIFGTYLPTVNLFAGKPDWYIQGVSQQGDVPPGRSGDPMRHFDLSGLTIDRNEIRAGGPPIDGIPALTDPKTAPVDQADFLRDDDRVIGVVFNDEARAYPVRLLNWHEIANDVVGEVPIAVVYCPLCDSFTVVDRRIGERTLEFGVSGLLYNSNVLLYDRSDMGLWSQVLMEAVSGPHAGEPLKHYAWDITTFADWKTRHPKSTVATFETGHARNYSTNPYQRYFQSDNLMFPVKREDHRLPKKEPVVGIRLGESYRAYPVAAIVKSENSRLVDAWNGHRVVIEADERLGRVVVTQMPKDALVVHTFWFTWAAFHPETSIYGAATDSESD